MDKHSVQLALRAACYLGESPLWSPREGALWWVNCAKSPSLHRFRPADGEWRSWPMPERVGGIALAGGGGLVVVLARGIHHFDPLTGRLEAIAPSPLSDHVSLHECRADRQGRLWVGSYDHRFSPQNRDARDGAIFRLVGTRLEPVIEGVSVANGMAFAPDGARFYVADSPTRRVMAYPLDRVTGELGRGTEFLSLPEGVGHVDGATVDEEGGYWLAVVGGGALHRYSADGTLAQRLALPVSNPTMPAFGGPDLTTLYVTTTRLPIGPDSEANGDLYYCVPGVRGLQEPEVVL